MKIRNRDSERTPMLLIGAFLLLYSFNAYAESPIVEIKSTVDQAIQILTDPQLQGEGKKARTPEKAARSHLCPLRFPGDGPTFVRGALAAPNS